MCIDRFQRERLGTAFSELFDSGNCVLFCVPRNAIKPALGELYSIQIALSLHQNSGEGTAPSQHISAPSVPRSSPKILAPLALELGVPRVRFYEMIPGYVSVVDRDLMRFSRLMSFSLKAFWRFISNRCEICLMYDCLLIWTLTQGLPCEVLRANVSVPCLILTVNDSNLRVGHNLHLEKSKNYFQSCNVLTMFKSTTTLSFLNV